MTTAEAILYYQRSIRCHPRHGAYVSLDILAELRTRPDCATVTDALFTIINWHNAPLLNRDPGKEDSDNEIEFCMLD